MIPPSVRIFLCPEPIDMRYGFDRLVHLCRQRLGQDPVLGGAVFVFVGCSATRLRLLWFEGHGLCVLYKRLHRAVFKLPSSAPGQRVLTLDSTALAELLASVASVRMPKLSAEIYPRGGARPRITRGTTTKHVRTERCGTLLRRSTLTTWQQDKIYTGGMLSAVLSIPLDSHHSWNQFRGRVRKTA